MGVPVRGFKSEAGKPYSPSNGTEGESFLASMCSGCARNTKSGCHIIMWMMSGVQRKEWVIDTDGQPVCTAFRTPKDRPATPRCKSTADMFSE